MTSIDPIVQIEEDFTERNEPFDDVVFPEERLLDTISYTDKEDALSIISAFATFDYNRDANQLVDNLISLSETEMQYFRPRSVPLVKFEDELETVFKDIGFRYPSRDAHAWCKNNEIINDQYNGNWTELLLETGCDAPDLIEQLNDDNFNCLKGVKIAPMYARIIDDFIADLDNLWELDIPIDTHTRRLSKDLFDDLENVSDDMLREEWRRIGKLYDVNVHKIDGSLWHIGNKWNDWGKDYWQEVKK
jgi:hypothetical protein